MKTAFIFPGQGTQFVGMGSDLYQSSSLAKKMFDRANEVLGFNLTQVMFNGPEEDLRQTEIAQPAIFLHSYCSYLLLGNQPAMASGHSLGMYTALAAAGAFSFEEALRLVRARAEAMQYASKINPGTMAVILGLVDSDAEIICQEARKVGYVCIANYNSFGQAVISGTEDAIIEAIKLAKQNGAHMAKRLPVSGAFHSLLMEPAYDGLDQALGRTEISICKFPVYSDLGDGVFEDAGSIRRGLLKQLVNPVRWPDVIQQMIADGANEFVEVGPGKVLQGLIKRIINGNGRKNNGISNS